MALYALILCTLFGAIVVFQESAGRAIVTSLVMMAFGFFTASLLVLFCGLGLAVFGALAVSLTQERWKRACAVCTVFGLCWSPFLLAAAKRYQRVVRLRPRFEYVSLADRVQPTADPVLAESPGLRSEERGGANSILSRRHAIRHLHQSAIFHFLNAPEFGIARMLYPNLHDLENENREPILLSSLHSDEYSEMPPEPDAVARSMKQSDFQEIAKEGHVTVSNWFVSAESLGEIKDVRSVAGFRSHGINQQSVGQYSQSRAIESVRDVFAMVPASESSSSPDFRLTNIQLVGLLYHDLPVVYDIETLPDSATAKTAPTRPLDEFEADAIEQLKVGESLVVKQLGDEVRVFGGLWNATSCQQCHEGSDQQLLGGFSYRLTAIDPTAVR